MMYRKNPQDLFSLNLLAFLIFHPRMKCGKLVQIPKHINKTSDFELMFLRKKKETVNPPQNCVLRNINRMKVLDCIDDHDNDRGGKINCKFPKSHNSDKARPHTRRKTTTSNTEVPSQ